MPKCGPISIRSCCCRWLRLGPLISGRCRRCLRVGPWLFRKALPTPLNGPIEFAAAAPMVMASLGPISFLGGAIYAPKWAHCVRCSSCRWLCTGLLFFRGFCPWLRLGQSLFWEALPMPKGGPISIRSCCCRGLRLGPPLFCEVLPMPKGGPISICSCCCRWLRLGPLISGRCRRCLRMGPWLFREALPTPLNGPIEFAAAAPMVMASLGPISFLGGAIDALKWADRNRHAEPIPIGLQWPKASKRAAKRHSQMGLMRTANALMVNLHWPIKCIISLNTRLSLAYLPI
jgi:hypothetical protein